MFIRTVLLSLGSALVSAAICLAAPRGMLDGKTYAGEIKSQSSEKPDADNFIFNHGTFRSTACDDFGYTAAPYSTGMKGGQTTFHAETRNSRGASIAWNGSISGDEISGTAVMTDSEGEKTNMTFKGTLQK